MRNEKTVLLGDAAIRVKELTVAHVVKLLPVLSSSLDSEMNIGLLEVIENKWHEILPFIEDCIVLPEQSAELGYGDMETIGLAFYEVNQPFFNRAGQLLGVNLDKLVGVWTGNKTTSSTGALS